MLILYKVMTSELVLTIFATTKRKNQFAIKH